MKSPNKPDIIIRPNLDERTLDGYYFQKFYCSNCHRPHIGDSVDVMVKKGTYRPKVLICPNCKTRSLK